MESKVSRHEMGWLVVYDSFKEEMLRLAIGETT
jgi:hypothetical protein